MAAGSTPAAAYPHPVRAWWSVAVLAFGLVLSFTDRLMMSAMVDPVRADLHISDAQVGMVQGATFAVVYAFSGLFLGRAADRSRRLTILFAGVTIWCLATVACGLATSYWQLLLARAVVGLGEAALGPAAVSIVADSFPPARRGGATSVLFLGSFLGGPISIFVGGIMLGLAQAGTFDLLPLVGHLSAWRQAMVLVGFAGLITPVLLLTLKEPPRQDRVGAEPVTAMIRDLSSRGRLLTPLYLAMGLMCVGDYAISAWVPTVLTRRFAIAPDAAGAWFGAVTASAGILGCLLAGPVSDRAARKAGVRGRLYVPLVTCLAGLASALFIAGGDTASVYAGLGLWTLFSAVSSIAGIAALQALIPGRHNGVGIALLAFCNVMFGLGMGPVLAPLATDRLFHDPQSVGAGVAIVAASAALIAALLLFASARSAAKQNPSHL